MKIPKEVLNKWEGLKDRGDIPELEKLTGKSQPVISKAFQGTCTAEVFKVIADFYNEREKMVKDAA